MPIIETRTTMLREKPLAQLEPPTPEQRQNWIQRTLATNRLPIIGNWEPMDVNALQARVNQGRWLVDCPICRGAEMADSTWLFFACCSCGAGIWPVVFPVDRTAIEAALLERPGSSFMSWSPGTSVEELLAAGPFHYSWTAPRTYVTGEIVTASILNTDHRDNLLVLEGGSKGQHLVMNNAETAPVYSAGLDIIDRDLSTVDVVDTVTETSLYSHTILAGSLGATGGIRLYLTGDRLDDSGTARNTTIRVKLGATTVLSSIFTASLSSNRRIWSLQVLFLNSAVSAQKWGGQLALTIPGTGSLLDSQSTLIQTALATSSENTALARTLDVTIQWEFAAPTRSFRKEMALLERIAA